MLTLSKFKTILTRSIPHSDYEVSRLTSKHDGVKGYRVRLFKKSVIVMSELVSSGFTLDESVTLSEPFFIRELVFVEDSTNT